MRTLLLVIISLVYPIAKSAGQSVDYNKIILPDNAANVSFEERLVQLAWQNNPASKIADQGVQQAYEEGRVATTAWSTLVGVTGNLNEFSIKRFTDPNAPANQFYPRYNFFVQLPLSLIAQNPHIKKAARARVSVAQNNVNLTKLSLRATVLKLYSEYKKAELVLLVRKQSSSDDESNYLLVEQKFKNGELMVDDYMRAQRGRNDLKIQLAIADNDFKKAKLDVEEIIGMRLEDVR